MPDKYERVEVHPLPCSQEELERHLRAFVRSFVQPNRQQRWLHILVQKPSKAEDRMYRLVQDLDDRYCTELKGADNFPLAVAKRIGTKPGAYFDRSGECNKMTAAGAATLASESSMDALLSLIPGKLALYWHHDLGGPWLCKRTD